MPRRLLLHAQHAEDFHLAALRSFLIAEAHERVVQLLFDFAFKLPRHDGSRSLAGAETRQFRLARVGGGDAGALAAHVLGRNVNADDGFAVRLGFDGDVHDKRGACIVGGIA